MSVTRLFPMLFLAVCVFASSQVQAQIVNITVQGNVQDTVCTPTMDGPGVSGNTITLPTIAIGDLQTTGPTTYGREVRFRAINCAMSGSLNFMWVHFTSPQVVGGRMVPQVGTTELHFEIQDVDSTGNPLGQVMVSASGTTPGDQPGAGQGTGGPFTGAYPNRVGEKKYLIRYYVESPVTQVGTLSTPATYEVKYY